VPSRQRWTPHPLRRPLLSRTLGGRSGTCPERSRRSSDITARAHPSFRAERADFFSPLRSCEAVGSRREKSLFLFGFGAGRPADVRNLSSDHAMAQRNSSGNAFGYREAGPPAFQCRRRKLFKRPCITTLSLGAATRTVSLRFRINRRSWYCPRLVLVRLDARASSRAHLLSASVSLMNLADRLRRRRSGEDLMKKLPLFVTYVIPSLSIRIPSLFQDTK
jgi:hypothetical protein